jgi:deoxyxylulose-5-phosphate synthase
MERNGDRLTIPDLEELFSDTGGDRAAIRTNQLARRLPPLMAEVLTKEEADVIRLGRIKARILTVREELNKRGVETDIEMLLHANEVFAETVSEMVQLKNSIIDDETRSLVAGFSQYLLSDVPEELRKLLRIGWEEVEKVLESDLTQKAQPRIYEEKKLSWFERWTGKIWVPQE